MNGLLRPALGLVLVGLLAACGGGGGGDGDAEAVEVLLLEFPVTRDGQTTPGGDEIIAVLRFGPNDTDLRLAVVDTDSDGTLFEVDPGDPALPLLVQVLRNGQTDSLSVRTTVGSITALANSQDTDPLLRVSENLQGPDLIGAGITRVGFRVDQVDITTVGDTTADTLTASFVVFGFPN